MPFDATPPERPTPTDPAIEVMERMRELLRQPGAWLQRDSARQLDGDGNYAYCMSGALWFCTGRDDTVLRWRVIRLLGFDCGETQMVNWNDAARRTQRGVLRRINYRLRKARELAANVEP